MSFRKYGVIFAYSEEIDWTNDRQSGGLEFSQFPPYRHSFDLILGSRELKFKKLKSIFLLASACSDS